MADNETRARRAAYFARMRAQSGSSFSRASALAPRTRTGQTRARGTGRLLTTGHFLLVTVATVSLLTDFSFGRSLIFKSYNGSLGASVSSWPVNGVVHTAAAWSNALPWASGTLVYIVLGAACLLIQRFGTMPGWLSLPVSVAGAAYGTIAAVASVQFLVADWPIGAGAAIAALIALTVARHR